MPINLGISGANHAIYRRLLCSNHRVDIITQILDLNHNRLGDISTQLGAGQLTMDSGADITRSVNLAFHDPQRTLSLDANSPADGALFLDRMIAVYYKVSSPDRKWWVSVPIFCGPVTKLDRDKEFIDVECHGKESLGLDPVWTARTFKAGAYKVDIIRTLLEDIGETKFSLRASSSKITRDLAVSSEHKPWVVAKQLASSMAMQLFYDGRGVATTRVVPTSSVWAYRDSGEDWSLVTKPPQVGYDIDGFTNTVVVKGATPAGKTAPLTYRLSVDRSHPLSPWSLGRNGKPRFVSREFNDDSLTTMDAIKAVAKREVARGANEAVDVAFDSLVIPHLEENDPYQLVTDEFSTVASVKQMTIPLQVSGSSSMGYLRSTKPNTASIRRRR